MSGARNRKWPTIVIMVIAVTSVTVGDLFMSAAMRGLGPLELETLGPWWRGEVKFSLLAVEVYQLGYAVFSQPLVWFGIAFMLLFLVLWMVALSWSELTFVMPLTALTYVLNAVLVGPFLGEEVTPLRWLGTILIAFGVVLVSTDAEDDATAKKG